MAEPRRRKPREEPVAERLASLEARLAEVESRLARLEGGEVRVLKAGLFDGRARARPQKGPKCPGCRLVVDVPCERCPFCGLAFRDLPPSQRPVPLPPRRPARPAAGKRGGGTRKAVPAREKRKGRVNPRAGS